jgi:hypothetical protein
MSLSVEQLPGFAYPLGTEPSWLRPTVAAMNRLLDLPPNWDSYGARPIVPGALVAALQLLQQTMQPDTPPPSVVPMPSGGVQLEWHRRGIEFEIELTPGGEVSAAYEDDRTGESWEHEQVTDLGLLENALSVLAERG